MHIVYIFSMVVDSVVHSSSSVFIFCYDWIIPAVTSLQTENQIFVHDDEDLNLTWFAFWSVLSSPAALKEWHK